VFWQRHQELPDWEKVIKNIERGEQKIQRQADIMQAIRTKLDRYKNPWQELKVGCCWLHLWSVESLLCMPLTWKASNTSGIVLYTLFVCPPPPPHTHTRPDQLWRQQGQGLHWQPRCVPCCCHMTSCVVVEALPTAK
jgi:hypothetical protein